MKTSNIATGYETLFNIHIPHPVAEQLKKYRSSISRFQIIQIKEYLRVLKIIKSLHEQLLGQVNY